MPHSGRGDDDEMLLHTKGKFSDSYYSGERGGVSERIDRLQNMQRSTSAARASVMYTVCIYKM